MSALASWPDTLDAAGSPSQSTSGASNVSKEKGFLAGVAHGEIWMLDLTTNIRVLLGEVVTSGNLQDPHVNVVTCLGRYIFVGAKRGSRNVLQAFDVHSVVGNAARLRKAQPYDLALDFESHSKQRGLTGVQVLLTGLEDPRGQPVLVGSGRGIGRAHLWRFWLHPSKFDVEVEYIGSAAARTNTITSIGFSACGKRVAVTNLSESFAQLWELPDGEEPFDLRSGHSKRVDLTVDAICEALLGHREAAEKLLNEHAQFSHEPNIEDILQSRGSPWTRLFPPRLLDPAAYDGDTNEKGQPHGIGTQRMDATSSQLYTGEWKNGERHGVGQVVDERTEKIVYVGGWRHDKRHGFGLELRTGSTDTGEIYEGWWRHGARHGLGSVYLSKQASGLTSENNSKDRIRYVGFFRDGKQHGLGWWTWPAGSPLLPFAVTLDAMAHLGAIRCIVQFKDGQFFDEFDFHRADGKPIAAHEQNLFNFPARRRAKFSDHPDGRWTGAECWGCMSSEDDDKEWVTCGNPSCGMRMHLDCLGRTARQFPSWDLARALYCEDLEERELKQLRQHVGDHLVFYCPMPACQEMALLLPEISVDGISAPVKRKKDELHNQCNKGVSSDENGNDEDADDEGADEPGISEHKIVATSNQSHTSNNSSTCLKSKANSNKKASKKKGSSKARKEHVQFDENLYLRMAMAEPPFAGAKLPQGDGPFAFYNADGDLVVVSTDEDMEEALEETALRGLDKLQIFSLAAP
mmetsp:Transcript_9928/g.19483  ORF Transcript_9928/g.19483 Transcript_9928/m.19483 type:complete len:745 (-) Transcript_9928:36-2270(-)